MKITTFVTALCIAFLFIGCSKKNESGLKLEQTKISIVAGETQTLTITPNIDGCIFESENSSIASVSSAGVVKGLIVGETIIKVTNKTNNFSAKCKVTVTPQYQMYREPYLNFGASAGQIKSYETRELISETTTGIVYGGENSRVKFVVYLLENSKYKSAGVYVPYSSSNTDLLVNFMCERYIVDVYDDDIIFLSIDEKIGGGITVSYNSGQYYYVVIYFEIDFSGYARSKYSDNIIMDHVREQFESIKPEFQNN